MRVATALVALIGLLAPCTADAQTQSPPLIADLGKCSLIGGGTLEGCRIAYRTFGKKEAGGANAILMPTWLRGTSTGWIQYLGSDRIIDTTQYFVVVVDALGDGQSSSPSNSPNKPFPSISIEDMVASQYRLAREFLGLTHLRAVVGYSMGGIQAFEWAAAYPNFVDRFVSIEGSPQVTRHDHAWLITQARIIDAALMHGLPLDTVFRILGGINVLINSTQEAINRVPRPQADSLINATATNMSRNPFLADWAAQDRAIIAYDFARRPGADSSSVARLKGRFLVIASLDDRIISADPALSFARRIGADTVVIPSSCGHGVIGCETPMIGRVIRAFLRR